MFIVIRQQSPDYLPATLIGSARGITQPYDFPADRVLTIRAFSDQVAL